MKSIQKEVEKETLQCSVEGDTWPVVISHCKNSLLKIGTDKEA